MFMNDPGIDGRYQLVGVDGKALPCCAETDSTGAVGTTIGGTLTLGYAAPEDYVEVPSGAPKARSCVHGIPDGAWVDATTNVVHLPDGSTYQLPECGDAAYTMVITRRYEYPDGSSRTASDTTGGKYTWGTVSGGALHDGVISLVRSRGFGSVNSSSEGIDLRIQFGVRVGPLPATGPQYEFRSSSQ